MKIFDWICSHSFMGGYDVYKKRIIAFFLNRYQDLLGGTFSPFDAYSRDSNRFALSLTRITKASRRLMTFLSFKS